MIKQAPKKFNKIVFLMVLIRAGHRGGHPELFSGAHSFWGAHRGPYGKFFFDERKNDNFWLGMMLLKLNSQSFSLYQEPLQALLRPIWALLKPFWNY